MKEAAAPKPLRAHYEVAVIGAGISGLALSYLLQKAGKDVLLLEADSQVGGVIRSERRGAMLFERGPNTLFVDDALRRLLKMLELEDEIISLSEGARLRYLCTKRSPALTPAPRSLAQAITSPLLSTRGKLRALAEPLYAPRWKEDVSIEEFITAHFGAEVAQELAASALTGVWAGDITELSAECCLPSLWQRASHNHSLIIGGLRGGARSKRLIASLPEGLSQLCERLAERLSADSLQLGRKVEHLVVEDSAVLLRGEDFDVRADYVCLCVPAHATARLIRPYEASLAEEIFSIRHQSLAITQLSFARAGCRHPLDGVGYLASPSLRRKLLGALFFSSMFPAHSSSERAVLSVFTGGAHGEPETLLSEESLEELRRLLGISSTIDQHGGRLWKDAIPNYSPGHRLLREKVSRFERGSGRLALTGNWLDGISIPDRIRAAQDLAERLTACLAAH